jgi:UDP-N-acetylmuramyl-tripeptide synthetase
MQALHTPSQAAQWLQSRVTGTLQIDSRKVRPGDGFIAWPGAATDGRQHVPSALANGAVACLVEQSGLERFAFVDAATDVLASYSDLKAATGPLAALYCGAPSQQLQVVAITGTNGKTSSAWWLAQALSNLKLHPEIPCGLIGTLGIGKPPKPTAAGAQGNTVVSTGLTTPDPVLLQQAFRRFVGEGLQACAIEASSIGVAEHRLDGTAIHTAVFTNFTQDHLDYHGSMVAYWQAKAALFDWPGLRSAVVNVDDGHGLALAKELATKPLDVWTVSCGAPARLQALNITYGETEAGGGLCFTVAEGAEQHTLQTRLIGQYNVSNLLGVIAAMRTLGVPLAACVDACADLSPVPGRMECVSQPGQPLVAVDYAHTPDALEKALQALQPLAAQRGGQLWCVFGCGGDRDPGKRPLMGAVAAQQAQRVLVTSDNPRSEQPQVIVNQILQGTQTVAGATVSVELDRATAIAQVLAQAAAQDVVLVAGKGHEDYQDIGGARRPFSDLAQVRAALQGRTQAATGVAA